MTSHDADIVARTIWGEARNQAYLGKVAIACVIMNRVKLARIHDHFGDGTPAAACQYPYQFSCWNYRDPNLAKMKAVTADDPAFSECLHIAQQAVTFELDDITGGATYYYVDGAPVPSWATGKTPCIKIGAHLFFKGIA